MGMGKKKKMSSISPIHLLFFLLFSKQKGTSSMQAVEGKFDNLSTWKNPIRPPLPFWNSKRSIPKLSFRRRPVGPRCKRGCCLSRFGPRCRSSWFGHRIRCANFLGTNRRSGRRCRSRWVLGRSRSVRLSIHLPPRCGWRCLSRILQCRMRP